MKTNKIKDGLVLFSVENKASLKEFLGGFKDRTLFAAMEQLPAHIAGEKGKAKLSCTVKTVDGVPEFGFMDFKNDYEGSEVMKGKSLCTVKINVPFEDYVYETTATVANESEAQQLIHTIATNPSATFECIVRRATKEKESASGTKYYPHYVSLMLPKLDTTQQAVAKQYAEQLV